MTRRRVIWLAIPALMASTALAVLASEGWLSATNARERRFTKFRQLLDPSHSGTILDVGGELEYWHQVRWHESRWKVVLLNLFDQRTEPGFSAVVGDARDLSRYHDGEFAIVHCNSVLGHVGGIEDQRKMAQEIRRVGRKYFVQTPNQRFPLDWRTLVPFFHWLPVQTQALCFRHFPVGTYPVIRDYDKSMIQASRIRNVTMGEMHELFPDAEIVQERVLGFTKSFIAIRR